MSYKWLNEITFLTVNFLVFAVLSHKKQHQKATYIAYWHIKSSKKFKL